MRHSNVLNLAAGSLILITNSLGPVKTAPRGADLIGYTLFVVKSPNGSKRIVFVNVTPNLRVN